MRWLIYFLLFLPYLAKAQPSAICVQEIRNSPTEIYNNIQLKEYDYAARNSGRVRFRFGEDVIDLIARRNSFEWTSRVVRQGPVAIGQTRYYICQMQDNDRIEEMAEGILPFYLTHQILLNHESVRQVFDALEEEGYFSRFGRIRDVDASTVNFDREQKIFYFQQIFYRPLPQTESYERVRVEVGGSFSRGPEGLTLSNVAVRRSRRDQSRPSRKSFRPRHDHHHHHHHHHHHRHRHDFCRDCRGYRPPDADFPTDNTDPRTLPGVGNANTSGGR